MDELSALSNMLIDNLVINNNPFNRTTPTPIVYIAKMLPNLQLIVSVLRTRFNNDQKNHNVMSLVLRAEWRSDFSRAETNG